MTSKSFTLNSRGEPQKLGGWFSWRHATPDAHEDAVARYGGTARERKDRRRSEAAARALSVAHDRTRAHRLGKCNCTTAALATKPTTRETEGAL